MTGASWFSREDLRRSWKPWLRGTAFGFPFGAMPTGGAEIPTFLSYATERRLAKGKAKEEFGQGAIEGVAGPEAANNAAFTGVLVPLLTIGIPTSATAAILLASFQIFDLQPGPQLFEREPDLVWALIASLYVGNVMLLVLNLPLIRLWVKVLEIPRPVLYTAILVFATLGVYSISGSVTEVLIAYAIGVLGFGMRRYDFPIAPVVLGVILGPLRRAAAPPHAARVGRRLVGAGRPPVRGRRPRGRRCSPSSSRCCRGSSRGCAASASRARRSSSARRTELGSAEWADVGRRDGWWWSWRCCSRPQPTRARTPVSGTRAPARRGRRSRSPSSPAGARSPTS